MNNYMIFQTKENTDLAIEVHKNAQISDVRLARAKVTADRPGSALKEQPITLSMGVKAERIEPSANSLLIDIDFRLTGSRNDSPLKKKTIICLECTFEVSYLLRPEFTPTTEQVNAFKDGNAIFNCWPYCRQYVQETIQKLGYPPLILPFLQVLTKQNPRRKPTKP